MSPANLTRSPAVVTADTGGDGTVYLLIHGIGVSSRYFERLVPRLAPNGRVVTIDLPGFGRAPKPDRPYTVEDFAEVVADVVDRLRLGSCVVVGHSMGSQVATRLALRRPDAVAALALIGPVIDARERSAVVSGLRLAQDTIGERPRANWLVLSDYLRCGLPWYLAVLPSMLAYRIEDDLREVTAPVTLIRGAGDPIARTDWLRMLAERGPAATAVEVAGARHLVIHSHPAETARQLRLLAQPAH
ncbi:alpha/beta fold hydrolase [Leifsonia poae]|uniref:Dihydrolipoamide acetyltransferase n=1 Tax=Leifsonia poae TaxID=110933 RepID=A0A9W6HAD0_9MICO|nr:alpha/beta hydrolase [Leifsonia poae]GLJ76866.1 dihydrolipoamide acetyltransferase [Leifsonia poae]